MPETDELYVMEGGVHGITTQESWDTIKDWLESIGKLDTTDMDSEVRIVNSDLGMDDTKEHHTVIRLLRIIWILHQGQEHL